MTSHFDHWKTREDIKNSMSSAHVFQVFFAEDTEDKKPHPKGCVTERLPDALSLHGNSWKTKTKCLPNVFHLPIPANDFLGGPGGRFLERGDGMPSIAVSGIDTSAMRPELTSDVVGGDSIERLRAPSLKASEFTEIERREITLWRVYARWDGAVMEERMTEAETLDIGFRRRLRDYEAACDATLVQGAFA